MGAGTVVAEFGGLNVIFGCLNVVGRRLREVSAGLRTTEDRVGIASDRVRAYEARAVFAKDREVVRGSGVTALVGTYECLFGFGQPVMLDEQQADRERAIGVTALIGAEIRVGGGIYVTAFLEQAAELCRGLGVTGVVRACEGILGLGEPGLCEEQSRELNGRLDHAALIRPSIRSFSALHVAAVPEQHA